MHKRILIDLRCSFQQSRQIERLIRNADPDSICLKKLMTQNVHFLEKAFKFYCVMIENFDHIIYLVPCTLLVMCDTS